MCGRYAIFDEENQVEMRKILQEIEENFAGTPEQEGMKTGEIFPTNIAPVLLPKEGGGTQAVPLKWGYPRWNGPGVIINARQETAGTKNMFRASLAARRCVIPASGFFEWKDVGKKKKDKYFLYLPHQEILYMAGLYNRFKDDKTGRMYQAFVILTTEANASMVEIHNRMPVLLEDRDLPLWLSSHEEGADLLQGSGPDLSIRLYD
ncbi:MAG: SOS response-associated peptidase [Dehalobacterium sp.]|jgi:putative SOS response-associated peptidase YedK